MMDLAKRGSHVQIIGWAEGQMLRCSQTTPTTRCSDSMASSLGRKKLTCFYCGRRSDLKQSGFVREWQCTNCEAVNYLDENGEITDPPVAITAEAPMSVQFAQALPRTTLNADEALFCDDCLKNQHLFTASLAQYIPNERETLYDRKYYEFRNNLEKRYPQVCSDCEAGVLERIKQAGYTARTDHLRRLMNKTRSSRTIKRSWTELFQFWGGVIWWLGLVGQACWNVAGIFNSFRPYFSTLCSTDISGVKFAILEESHEYQLAFGSLAQLYQPFCLIWTFSWPYLDNFGAADSFLAKWSLILTVLSIWWNPKYRHWFRGFDSQIKGFREWYTYQIILVITEILFRYLMGAESFLDAEAPATSGAHTFMLAFTLMLAVSAHRSIKTDITPLFAPTPERLRPYVQHKETATNADMGFALNDIASEISEHSVTSNAPRLEYDLSAPRSHTSGRSRSDTFQNRVQVRLPGGITLPRLEDAPLLSAMTADESHEYLRSGNIPERLRGQQNEEMEWDPAPSKVLQMTRSPQTPALFQRPESSTSAANPSPFWFKVPSAPVGPAHRLRNPPNQPRFQTRTEEAKQDFFHSMTDAAHGDSLKQIKSNPGRPQQHEIEMAQQKFFPPITAADSIVNGLSEMFGTVQLTHDCEIDAASDIRSVIENPNSRRWSHIFTAVGLTCTFIGWKYISAYHWGPDMGVVVICGSVALRSIADYTITRWSTRNSPIRNSLGITIASIELAAAGWGILRILAQKQQSDADHSPTAALVCVTLLHEIWLAL